MQPTGDKFPYSKMRENIFYYVHDGSVALYDTMQISVSDGVHMTSTSIDIKVMRIDQAAPRMEPSAVFGIFVREGGFCSIQIAA